MAKVVSILPIGSPIIIYCKSFLRAISGRGSVVAYGRPKRLHEVVRIKGLTKSKKKKNWPQIDNQA